jgi:hypothetical protein
MERPPGTPTPCHMCPKVPRGAVPRGVQARPEHAIELSRRNAQAYWHYLECKATGRFPDDPIVRRNAALIRLVEEEVERERGDPRGLLPVLVSLLRR